MVTGNWTPQQRITLVGVVLLVVLVAFESIAVATAMPLVAQRLDGVGIYPVAFAVPYGAAVVAMVGAGQWADLRGPRVVLCTGTALFVGGLVLAGAANSMPTLVLGRTVQSFGGGLDTVALYVLIARVFPQRLRPRVFVWTSAAWVAPALFGPPLAGYLASQVSWRWVFWVAAVFAVPAIALLAPALCRVPVELPARSGRGMRTLLAAASAAAVGVALLSVAADRPPVLTAVLGGVGAGLLVVGAPRLVPRGTFRAARGMPAVVLTRGLLAAAFVGTDVYLPLLLTRQHAMSTGQAGLVLSVGAISWCAGAWRSGRLTSDAQLRTAVRVGLCLLAVGIGAALVSVWSATPAGLVYLAWAVGGFGIGSAYSPLTVLLMGMSAPQEQGRNSSALQTGEMLAQAVLLAVSAVVFAAASQLSQAAAFASGLGVALPCALLGILVSRRLAPGEGCDGGRPDAGKAQGDGARSAHSVDAG